MQSLIKYSLHGQFEVVGDKFLNEVLPHHLFRGVSYKLLSILIPYIDSSLVINPKDGCIGSVDEFRVLSFLCQTSRDILLRRVYSSYYGG